MTDSHKKRRALEALAALEHERWSHWQRYLHEQCESNNDGSLTIPAELVNRWTRQMTTPYQMLTEKEKSSDREVVNRDLEYLIAIVMECRN